MAPDVAADAVHQFDVSITIKLFDGYLTMGRGSQRATAFQEWNAALREKA